VRTVLIFAHECAPFHRVQSTIGAQRPAQFAKHLPLHGWRAIVVCCDSNARESIDKSELESVRAATAKTLGTADPTETVVIATPSLRFDGPLDRLWKASQSVSVVRKALTVAKYRTGDYSQSWQPCARIAAEEILRTTQVDACIGEHSPDAGLHLASWLQRSFNVPWIADFRDPVLQPMNGLGRSLYAPIVRRVVGSAKGTVAVNSELAILDRDLFRKECEVIPNGFDVTEFEQIDRSLSRPIGTSLGANTDVVLAYAGSIHGTVELDLFLRGIAKANEAGAKRFVFKYRGLAADLVSNRASELAVDEFVDVAPHVDRADVLRMLTTSDWLVAFDRLTNDRFSSQGLVPAKVFEYLGARRPIVSVAGAGGILDAFLRETRSGWRVSTVDDVANLLLHPPAYDPDDAAIAAYDRFNLAGQLARYLDRVV
jgi:hypothetical protein